MNVEVPNILPSTHQRQSQNYGNRERDLRRVPSVPHTLQGSPAKYIKTLSPESIRPMYGINSGICHLCKTALTHIRQSIALRKCSRDGERKLKEITALSVSFNMDNFKIYTISLRRDVIIHVVLNKGSEDC